MKKLRIMLVILLLISTLVSFNSATVNAATISSGSTFASTDGTSGRLVINSVISSISGSTWNVSVNFNINMVNSWLYTGGADYERYFSAVINGVSGGSMQIKTRTESWNSGTSRTFTYSMSLPVNPDNNVASARFRVADGNNALNDVASFDTGSGNTVTLQAVQKATGLSLNISNSTLYTGQTQSITPTVTPSNTYNKEVNYTSSNTAIATVSSSGVITAVKAGSATITVTTKDGSNISRTVAVNVKQYVTGISLNDTSPTIYAGSTFQLIATTSPGDATDKSLSYSSNNTAVATVNSSGLITALKAGTATITVTALDRSTVKAISTVTVLQRATSLSVNNPIDTLYSGSTHQMSCTVAPADTTDKSLIYTSSNTAAATVNAGGLITAIKAGSATITVKTADGSNITKTMNITVKQYVTGVSLNNTSPTINTGGTFQLTATTTPGDATDKSISYSSNNTAVATVNASGLITAVKAGSATITVTALDRSTIKATATVTVLQKATSLTINAPPNVLYTTVTSQLNCTVSPADTSDKSLTFTSSDPTVATVSAGGLITAKKTGTSTITVKTNDGSNITKSFLLTVKQYVTSVSVNDTSPTLYTGSTFQLSATAAPSDANDKSLSYSSNNTAVATVNASGLITAVKAGTSAITITATDQSTVKATATVTVLQKATSLIINAPPNVLYTTATSQLNCTVSPADTSDKSLTYTSSDPTVAAVSAGGLITAKKAGPSTITVKTNDGSNITKSFLLTVKQYVTSLAVTPVEPVIYAGSSLQLNISALPEDATDKSLICTSNNEEIATVSNTGKITAKKAGVADITVTASDRSTIKANVTVTVLQRATSLTIDNPIDILYTSQTHQLNCTVLPTDTTDKSVTLTSSDPTVATVFDTGLITAVKAGTTNITVKTADGSNITKIMELTVKQYVTSLVITPTEPIVYAGSNLQLGITALPEDASDKSLICISSDEEIAIVSSTGLITAKKAGTADITVTAKDRSTIKSTVKITVLQRAASLSIENPIDILYTSETHQLNCTVLPTDTTDKSVTFTSSDPTVATVSDTGLITAVKAGTTNISIKTADGSDITKIINLTVMQYVTSLEITPADPIIYAGDNLQLGITALPEDASDKKLSCTSSDEEVATVSDTGKITAKKAGTADITITASDRNIIIKKVTITVNQRAESLTVDNKPDEIYLKHPYQLTYTVLPEDTTDKTVTYTSSDNDIAEIDYKGLITPFAKGKTTITVSTNDGSDIRKSFKVEIKQYVESVASTVDELTLYTGEHEMLEISVLPTDANNQDLEFSSSDYTIASVNANGKITGMKSGFADITVRSTDGSDCFDTIKVTVKQYAKAITVLGDQVELPIENTYQILPIVAPDDTTDKHVTYCSSDENILTVDENGLVTAHGSGKAKVIITASDRNTVNKEVNFTVKRLITDIIISEDTPTEVYTGKEITISCNVQPTDASDKALTFISSDESIAMVNENGVVHGIKAGGVITTVKSNDGTNIQKDISIDVRQSIIAIGFGTNAIKLNEGEAYEIKSIIFPENAYNTTLQYQSSNSRIVKIEADGTIKAVRKGTAVVTAKATDGSNVQASFTVIVNKPVKSVIFKDERVNLFTGEHKKLSFFVFPYNASNKSVAFTSANPSIVQVDEAGNITAIKEGNTFVTVSSIENPEIKDTCNVIVQTKNLPIAPVTPDVPAAPIKGTVPVIPPDKETVLPENNETVPPSTVPDETDVTPSETSDDPTEKPFIDRETVKWIVTILGLISLILLIIFRRQLLFFVFIDDEDKKEEEENK